ncbi:5111_t:CDS:2, partial [Entrophospora sp. SA101]
ELNNAQQTIGLSPEEETELLAINNYLTEPELRNELELKKIADILLNLEDKTTFFMELQDYLKGKKVPEFPADTVDDYTLSLKMEDKMTLAKNEQKLGLDLTKYGNGTEFTEAGIIRYYAEELGGINHSYSKNEPKKQTSSSKEGF